MIFESRIDAAKALIPYLEKYKNSDVVVLAIPRGGVPMGDIIARHFNWKMTILLTKKIGHPLSSEYAIGAVSLVSRVLNEDISDVPQAYIESETIRIRQLLNERRIKFIGQQKEIPIEGKTLVIVDDGIGTGFTMKVSVEMLKNRMPAKIIIAVPIASPRIIDALREMVDDIIVLDTPMNFGGVGQFYEDFSEITDQDVIAIMKKYNN